jgi:hypothetical protein
LESIFASIGADLVNVPFFSSQMLAKRPSGQVYSKTAIVVEESTSPGETQRMRGTVWTAVVLILGCETANGGDEPVAPAPAVGVAQLLEQLGSGDFQQREAAYKSLETLGPETLPLLRQAANHRDPEIRRRLQQLIPHLEKMAALTPRRVSLHLTNRRIRDALAEITRQTGYKIQLQQGGDRDKHVYTFQFDQLSFWEAMDKVCDAGALTFQNINNDVMQYAQQDSYAPFVSRSGPFRLVATGFNYSRTVDFNQVSKSSGEPGQRNESLYFSFTIATEPKLPLLQVGEVKLLAAYDDRNRSMLPIVEQNTNNNEMLVFGGGMVCNLAMDYGGNGKNYMLTSQASMIRPARTSRTVKLIRGTIMTTLLIEQRPEIIIEDVLKSKGKKLVSGKTSWSMEDVGEATNGGNKNYRVKMSLTDDNKRENNDNSWINSLYQRIELHDAKGNKYQLQGTQWESVTATNVHGELTFGDPGIAGIGPPVKLIYYTWISALHPVAFEFKNLPLP